MLLSGNATRVTRVKPTNRVGKTVATGSLGVVTVFITVLAETIGSGGTSNSGTERIGDLILVPTPSRVAPAL